MNGSNIFLDTNICIYLLNGDVVLADLLQDQNVFISFITEIELFSYHANNERALDILRDFIGSVTVVDIDGILKRKVIELRKDYKLKLPDTIIAASALVNNIPFITADKAFRRIDVLDLVLYERNVE